jgi:signal transduction histidine kinase/DNA-binding response OmpR family regulator
VNGAVLSVAIKDEPDVVGARQRARQIAASLGFDAQDQTRIATAVSEIARNAFTYAGGGRVDFLVEGRTQPQLLVVRVADTGRGIDNLQDVLDGRYRSKTGMGLGIIGARRLMDQFEIESAPSGTVVLLKKLLPRAAGLVSTARLSALADGLMTEAPRGPLQEIQLQNQELLRTLDELRTRQDELLRLNGELEDTNRGVIALYAELDEKADHLRRADELKSRFLSNMSHEFRTPLNAIRALTHVLVQSGGGSLDAEQRLQIGYIRKAADELAELVDDLLDLAKVEAGKVVIRPTEFDVSTLFSSLRGMLRPLLVSESVSLVFEPASELPPIYTDEGKVSQILRNLISNALKFTEHGEVRVSAAPSSDGRAVTFAVADTGIGIAPEDQERIFQEFGQLDSRVQRKVRGTGLGLPLSRKLAELLGGTLTVTSAPGVGSTFSAQIPAHYVEPIPSVATTPVWEKTSLDVPVLVVEDSAEELLVYEKYLKGTGFQIVPAATTRQARHALEHVKPVAIVLDILLRGEDTWKLLAELKTSAATRRIPVIVVTSVDDERKGISLGADAYAVKPVERRWLLDQLRRITGQQPIRRVLLIDDDEISRYLMRRLLDDLPCLITEASSGKAGLRQARSDAPEAILLDLAMPDMSGERVLAELRADTATASIPVVIVTSRVLEDGERQRLAREVAAIVDKGSDRRVASGQIRAALTAAGLFVK